MTARLATNDLLKAFPGVATRRGGADLQTAVLLDAAFDVMLYELARDNVFDLCDLAFKGGTALRKFHFGHGGRFSFDLDFDAGQPAADVVEIMQGALEGSNEHGFSFEIEERREHYSVRVKTDLLEGQDAVAKIDFSDRGLSLPPPKLKLIPTPLHASYSFPTDFDVPVIDIRENAAEKMSRWRTNQLVRDLYDLRELSSHLSDLRTVADLYVLKSYVAWTDTPSNRRGTKVPAPPLGPTIDALSPRSFSLDDLTLPSVGSEAEKCESVDQWLRQLRTLFDQIDECADTGPYSRFAINTDGALRYSAEQALASF